MVELAPIVGLYVGIQMLMSSLWGDRTDVDLLWRAAIANAAAVIAAIGLWLAPFSVPGWVMVAFAVVIVPLVDRPNELYSDHGILRDGSAYDQRTGVAVVL